MNKGLPGYPGIDMDRPVLSKLAEHSWFGLLRPHFDEENVLVVAEDVAAGRNVGAGP